LVTGKAQQISQRGIGFLQRALQVPAQLGVDLTAPAERAVNEFGQERSI
jgi:hypothetical protein